MKVLVTYLSQTGNTKKVAEAIFDEITCEKELTTIDSVPGLDSFDLVLVGFPVWQSGPAEPARKFLDERARGKKVALFVTHAMDPDSPDQAAREMLGGILDKCRSAAAGSKLAGFFNCRGELSENVAAFLMKSSEPAMRRFGEMRSLTVGQPDNVSLDSARIFAREIIQKI